MKEKITKKIIGGNVFVHDVNNALFVDLLVPFFVPVLWMKMNKTKFSVKCENKNKRYSVVDILMSLINVKRKC